MSQGIHTIEIRSDRPDHVALLLARALPTKTRSGLLFVSGALASTTNELARALVATLPDINWLIVPSVGVLTERGEIEYQSAATALFLPTHLQSFVQTRADQHFAQVMCEVLDATPGACAFVSTQESSVVHGWIQFIEQHFKNQPPPIFGGGMLPGHNAVSIKDGIISVGAAACAVLPPKNASRFRSSTACRLISPLCQVTKSCGLVVQELDGMLALERLSEATAELNHQPLVLLAVATGENPLSQGGRSLTLKTIHGVDPAKGALIFDEAIPIGTRVAFAVRDAEVSRVDFAAQLTAMRLDCAGTHPDFGIFVSCAGRGLGLYGMSSVDVRLINKAFPKTPLIGMHGIFEIAPLHNRPIEQIYAAVLGVFCRPS